MATRRTGKGNPSSNISNLVPLLCSARSAYRPRASAVRCVPAFQLTKHVLSLLKAFRRYQSIAAQSHYVVDTRSRQNLCMHIPLTWLRSPLSVRIAGLRYDWRHVCPGSANKKRCSSPLRPNILTASIYGEKIEPSQFAVDTISAGGADPRSN